jgi:hypothetical protein
MEAGGYGFSQVIHCPSRNTILSSLGKDIKAFSILEFASSE